MKTIYKYPFKICDLFILELPKIRLVLDVQYQGSSPTMWIEVDTDTPLEAVTFGVRGTGQPFSGNEVYYIGTIQQPESGLVWHIYQLWDGINDRP